MTVKMTEIEMVEIAQWQRIAPGKLEVLVSGPRYNCCFSCFILRLRDIFDDFIFFEIKSTSHSTKKVVNIYIQLSDEIKLVVLYLINNI